MSLYPFFREFEMILLKIYEYSLGKIKLYNDELFQEEEPKEEEKDNNQNDYVEDETKVTVIKCKKFGKKFEKKRYKCNK